MAARTPEEWKVRLQQAEASGDIDTANKIRVGLKMPPIDVSGAPFNQRMAVAGSRGPGAQQQAAAQYGYQPFGQDNFISGDRIFNPPGMDMGDLSMAARPVAEAGGAMIGGSAGLIGAGGPTMGMGAIPGMMAGGALGGHLAGQGMDLLTPGRVDTRDTGELAGDLTTEALFNSMGGPTLAPMKAPKLMAPGATGGPASISAAADEVYERGGTTTPGQRGSGFFQRLEGSLESSPFAGPIMDRQRESTMDIFGGIIEDATPRAGSRDVAGDKVTDSFLFNKDWAMANKDDAYFEFDKVMDAAGGSSSSRISVNTLQDLSREYERIKARDPGFAEIVYQDPDLSKALSALEEMGRNAQRNMDEGTALPELPTYDIIKRLRTLVGKKIDFNSPGSEQMGLKDLYRTLTSDMEAGAFEIAGEAGARAARAANDANAKLMQDLKAIDPIFKYAENPTAVYDALNRALMNNPELVGNAKIAMGPNAWDTFTESWIRLNSRATKGGQDVTGDMASPHTTASALAHLKKVSPEGYSMLTEGKEESIAVIDRLAKMLRDSEKYVNRSRTANTTGMTQFGGDVIGAGLMGGGALLSGAGPTFPMVMGAAGLIARPIISKLTAKALTSRTLNKALTSVGRTYSENLPVGEDLMRALIAAGADEREVKEIFNDRVPLMEAGNEQPY